MSNLADLARSLVSPTLTRNQLKVIRARLRRAGLTNLSHEASGEYTVNVSLDVSTDVRATAGTILVAAIVEAA